MKLTNPEIGTILAALRLYQRRLLRGGIPVEIDDLATDGGEHDALTAEEIDRLCERINFGG